MQVDPMAQVGNILRALVRNTGDVIFVDEHHRGVIVVCRRQFLHINHGSIRNSAGDFKPSTAFTFNIFGSLGLSPQQRVHAKQHYSAACHQSIKSKRIHTKKAGRNRPWAADSLSGYAQSAAGGSGSAVTEVPAAVKIFRGQSAVGDFAERGSKRLLLRLAANTLADEIDEAAFGSLAKLIVMGRLFAYHKASAVITAVEPF